MKNEKVNLIDGTYSIDEAAELVNAIINAAKNCHQIKNLSSQVRFDIEDETAIRNICSLEKERDKFKQIVSHARSQNKNLILRSELTLCIDGDVIKLNNSEEITREAM